MVVRFCVVVEAKIVKYPEIFLFITEKCVTLWQENEKNLGINLVQANALKVESITVFY